MDTFTQAVLDSLMARCGSLIQECANLAGELAKAKEQNAELTKQIPQPKE